MQSNSHPKVRLDSHDDGEAALVCLLVQGPDAVGVGLHQVRVGDAAADRHLHDSHGLRALARAHGGRQNDALDGDGGAPPLPEVHRAELLKTGRPISCETRQTNNTDTG